MAKETSVFFTFRPTDQGGVTDQLMQFSAWYKLGRSLGYCYVHRPVNCVRSSLNVYDFLGFDALWKNQEPYPGAPDSVITLPISSQDLKFPYSWGFRGLKWFVRRAVRKAVTKIKSDTVLVEFCLHNVGDRVVFRMIEQSVSSFPDGINLRKSYDKQRELTAQPNLFKAVDSKVLVHIRQGDASVIPSPWDTYLSVYSTSVAEFPVLNFVCPKDADWDMRRAMRSLVSYLEPQDYATFLQSFVKQLGDRTYTILVSSDGYDKTFSRINESASKLKLTERQRSQLKELEKTYEQLKFESFSRLQNVELLLGESDENLFDLIHATLSADVIITSTQQQMLVKLIALYGRTENPPLMIMLHSARVKYINDIKDRLGDKVSNVIFVNVNDIAESVLDI